MPKGIGYQEASKFSAFRRKKSKDEENLRTKSIIKEATKNKGLTPKEIEAFLDKNKKRKK